MAKDAQNAHLETTGMDKGAESPKAALLDSSGITNFLPANGAATTVDPTNTTTDQSADACQASTGSTTNALSAPQDNSSTEFHVLVGW